ncbi:hypothetical protein OG592_40690 [Streptomyces avidinii]|uniref:hypothetical protein n=1 Tax=Streptomyces avidinii TaxID=1895 RepID=UPI00386A26FC|nr:hypothetical protein OG592_00115 [Streptomyces avidinii]WST50044.1 hypothetical protein OG592_40690 [Streptomyces avidinii]
MSAASRRRVRTLALALLGAVVVAGTAVPAASAAPAPAPAPSARTAQAAQFWQWGGEYTDRAGAELAGNLMVFSASAVTYYVEYVRQQQYVLWYR